MTGSSPTLHPGLGALVVGVGGALGAVARWALETGYPVGRGEFPWVTFTINVVGAALLAALPLLPAARRRAWVGVFVGVGVLGGFTTMSTASVETFALIDDDHVILAATYSLGTLAAAVAAVLVVDRLTTIAARAAAEDEGWDE